MTDYDTNHMLTLDDELRAERDLEEMDNPVIAQIQYINKDLDNVHSDICPPNHNIKQLTPEYRKLLHDCLDEWLDKSAGTGGFAICEKGFFFNH